MTTNSEHSFTLSNKLEAREMISDVTGMLDKVGNARKHNLSDMGNSTTQPKYSF
jgi:hypothetical protein